MTMGKKPSLGKIHHGILELLRAHPEGITIYQIREGLGNISGQQHLDKRVREIRYYFDVPQRGGKYFYEGERTQPVPDSGSISRALRAAVLGRAHGRCQMCGTTVEEDGIKLEVDHKVPRNWGGGTVLDNLQALCQDCNGGKRDFFASLNQAEMKRVAGLSSVYLRIAETLRMHKGTPVPSWLLDLVANLNDFQEDWQKRLRELRYPVIGLKIKATRSKTATGKWQAAYQLENWKPLPDDHKWQIKEYERKKKAKKKKSATP